MSQVTLAKQVVKFLSSFRGFENSTVTATNNSKVVTADITTAVGTLPLQIASATQMGIVLTPYGDNKIEVWNNTTKDKIADNNGNEVYGRLTEAGGVYTLSFFSLVVGVETAYTFDVDTDIDYLFSYQYDFRNLPFDAITKGKLFSSGNDPEKGGIPVLEQLTITGTNTIANLSFIPRNVNQVLFFLNRTVLTPLDGITVAGQVVTVDTAITIYDIETTDTIYASYER